MNNSSFLSTTDTASSLQQLSSPQQSTSSFPSFYSSTSSSVESSVLKTPFPVVTIDGPAASGKSSVSREIAHRLGWKWLSTGVFYRGLAYVARKEKIDLADEKALLNLAEKPNWSVAMDESRTRFLYNSIDVTDEISKEEIGSLASIISSFPLVRKALLEAQRKCAEVGPGLVAEGRDCGTIVFPQAHIKFFLLARADDRAARRALEQKQDVKFIQEEQKKRDAQDASRAVAPMEPAADAQLIDTSSLNFLEVVAKVQQEIQKRLSE